MNHQAHQGHSATASQPLPAQPRQGIDIQAAMDSARRRNEMWMQQIRNRWRNEQQAQEQLQHDEAEEERRRWQEERELIRRQQRLEEFQITCPDRTWQFMRLEILSNPQLPSDYLRLLILHRHTNP